MAGDIQVTTDQLIAVMVPTLIAFLTAVTSWIQSRTTAQKLNDHLNRKVDIPPPR